MKKNTNSFNLIEKGFIMSLQNIWRNKLLSLATVLVIAIIIFIFNVILSINFIANNSIKEVNQKIDLIVYLKESTSFDDAKSIITKILELDGVINVEYTSKDEALQKIQLSNPDYIETFQKYELGNPLPASIDITTEHPKYHKAISEFLSQERYQKFLSEINVNQGDNNSILSNVTQNLVNLSSFSYQIIIGLIITFVIGGALIILNALQITIFSRRKEIEIMELVGASRWFIKLPFLIESIIFGLLAIILSYISFLTISESGNFTIFQIQDINLTQIVLMEILITVTICIISSNLAVQEHLQKDIR